MLDIRGSSYAVKGQQGFDLPAGEPDLVIALPALDLLLADVVKSTVAAWAPEFIESLPKHFAPTRAAGRLQTRVNNAGAGTNVEAARALFMGSQAAVVAYGSPGTNLRFDWNEETRDNNNQVVITSSAIFGCKKVTFTTDEAGAQDFGVMALDTACASR